MALFKTGQGIISLRGRFGGVYFKTGQNSLHIQAMPRHINYSRSYAQGRRISAFSMFGMLFVSVLYWGFQALWLAFAATYLFLTRRGEKKKLPAQNWFIHYNMKVSWEKNTALYLPPESPQILPDYYATTNDIQTLKTPPDEAPDWWPSGNYQYGGDYAGMPYYSLLPNNDWWLWFDGSNYNITPAIGAKPLGYTWTKPGTNRAGYYDHDTTSDRTQVVTFKAAY